MVVRNIAIIGGGGLPHQQSSKRELNGSVNGAVTMIFTLWTFMYTSTLMVACISMAHWHPAKSLAGSFAVCLLYIGDTALVCGFLLLNILIRTCGVVIRHFFTCANHFVLSLDMLCLFSGLLLIFYHLFKIEKPRLQKA